MHQAAAAHEPACGQAAYPPAADFFIGAHAQTVGLVLLTCDPAGVRTYFSDLTLIAPSSTDHPLPPSPG